jgi:hypothetical protein
MFRAGRQYLTVAELRDAHRSYCNEYQIEMDFSVIEGSLTRAEILKTNDHHYLFVYSYFYYYFVARHLRDHLSGPEGQERLGFLVANIHQEESANILAFLTYLAKDRIVIDSMLTRARGVYSDIAPATLEQDAQFFNALFADVPRRVFEDRPSKETRNQINKELDKESRNSERVGRRSNVSVNSDINVAFKTIQILGQLIRNFSGSLPGDQKAEIAKECYLLGLRTLSTLLNILNTHQEILVTRISEALYANKKPSRELKREQTERQARRYLGIIIDALTALVCKKISDAVGSETLRQTIEYVRSEGNTAAFNLIDISIKLDHFGRYPMEEIARFVGRFKDGALAINVLRDLVVLDLYKLPRKREIRQVVCDQLGLEYRKVARATQAKVKFQG